MCQHFSHRPHYYALPEFGQNELGQLLCQDADIVLPIDLNLKKGKAEQLARANA